MSEPIRLKHVIALPEALEPAFEQLVAEYAAAHGEIPENCRRAVGIVILQKGLAALRVDANRRFGLRMGWNKEEEEKT